MTQPRPNTGDIARLAWPIALNAVLLHLVLIIDTVLVTPLGEESLTAMGLAASIAALILGTIFAFSNGTQLILAQAYGADNVKAMDSAYKAGLALNMMIAMLGTVLMFTLGLWLISVLSETTAQAALASDYLRIFSLSLFGVAVSQNITAYFNATGNSKIALYSNFIEAPVNVMVSMVLIYGWWGLPELKLAGAAIGSVVAVLFRVVYLSLARRRHIQKQSRATAPLNRQQLNAHFKEAVPIAGNFISMVFSLNACTLIYAKLGVNQFAAFTLIMPWIRVFGLLSVGWGQATAILVGQLLGRSAFDAVDTFIGKAWRVAIGLSALISLLYCAMFFAFEWVYPDLQQETRDTLWSFLPLLVVLPFVRVSNLMCGNLLRAGGDAMYSFKIQSIAQWLFTVPVTALLVLYFNLPAVWALTVILSEELLKAAPFHLRIKSGLWKKRVIRDN